MNADRLLAQYERIAAAPDAIARLRRFVLDLAVRGKLVEQDAGDEPASELLKRIAAEPRNVIVGGGIFAYANALPCSLAWEAFGEANGARSAQEMRARIARYRRIDPTDRSDFDIGCRILTQPFFFDERDWIAMPPSWSPNIVSFKTYNRGDAEGLALWEAVNDRLARPEFAGMAAIRRVMVATLVPVLASSAMKAQMASGAVVFGFGFAGNMTSLILAVREAVPASHVGRSTGIVGMIAWLGMGAGGNVSGWLYDVTGSHAASFALAAAAGAANLVTLVVLARNRIAPPVAWRGPAAPLVSGETR
jgi:hypothetical protein